MACNIKKQKEKQLLINDVDGVDVIDEESNTQNDERETLLEKSYLNATKLYKVITDNDNHQHDDKVDGDGGGGGDCDDDPTQSVNIPLCKMHKNEPSPTQDEDDEAKRTTTEATATDASGAATEATTVGSMNTTNSSVANESRQLNSNTKCDVKRPSTGSSTNVHSLKATNINANTDEDDDGGGRGGGGGRGSISIDDRNEETDIIGDLVGHFGKWQFLMTVLLSLFQVPNTFHISSSVYQAANKNYWCQRPAHLQHLPVDVWRNVSRSYDNCYQEANIDWNTISNTTALSENLQIQQLLTERSQYAQTNDSSYAGQMIACVAWDYETNDNVGNTWTSQWNLVCEKEYLKNVAEMFFLLGVATGGIISGYLSDKFGRKTMLFISALLQTIFGLALYFCSSFELYLTLRALLGLVSVSVTYAGLILAIEYVDGKWRTIAGMYNLFPLPISYMLISGIAYLTQDYQRLQLCIGLPGIFLCFLWFVVPESPRWLLVKGRIDEVKRIIEAAAKFNGRQLPHDYQLKPPTQEVSSQDFTYLFRSRYLRRISICFLCIWFTMNLVYYGIILNMSSFGGNVYLNSALAGLVEIPAIAIAMYIITKVGKKWLFCATLFCAGIACCCAAITEGHDDLLWLKITFLMIGKFTISAGNTIMPVYTAELYPTAIRNVGVGACNMAAGLALILTPYLSLLTKIESHLLMTLLTAWSIFGGFVVLFLPETMSQHKKKNPPAEKC